MTETDTNDANRQLRWGVYAVLMAVALGDAGGRILAVNSVNRGDLERHLVGRDMALLQKQLEAQGVSGDELEARLEQARPGAVERGRLQRPFLSANDRSRWLTVRALVEHGTYAIDSVLDRHVWHTIDMVQHKGADGLTHLYSSKPPMLATLVAVEYWILREVTGLTLADDPFAVGRAILLTINLPALALMFAATASLIDRFGRTDWGRVLAVAAITQATMLAPFAVVLNNHLIAAACAAAALYLTVNAATRGGTPWTHALVGLTAAFTACNELPALSLLVLVGAVLCVVDRRSWLTGFLPAVAIVAVAFFGTNYAAHQSLRPPYMHRSATAPDDNWYEYTYELDGQQIESYWNDRQGIDRGEPSRAVYAWHTLLGHHGVFSLTPLWTVSFYGLLLWLREGTTPRREIAAAILLLTAVCLVFFIGLRPQMDRNYGGMTSGFRWLFWFAPLWSVPLVAGADRLGRSRIGQALLLVLLSFSILSAKYPTWNPWVHPWAYDWMEYLGWAGV
ncbi:MAG: hypothetical protein AAGA92_15810 [Planctomycetota bacterium]